MRDENLRHEGMRLLAGGIAHDLNNLLMSISGNAELALMDVPAESSARECLQDIGLAARRAVDRCNEMMVYAGRRPLAPRPQDPAAVLQDAVRPSLERAPAGVEWITQLAHDLPSVALDGARLGPVLAAIADNALAAVGAGPGTVTTSADTRDLDREALTRMRLAGDMAPGRFVCLEVRDSGPGMDEATLRRMFDPYFSTDAGRRGLGLAWVIGIVHAHGGAIDADSVPGQGTAVRIYLPIT